MNSKRLKIDVQDLIAGILAGDKIRLGRAITLIESKRPEHAEAARAIIKKCMPHSGNSFRIGITGTPGVGKSTFIEAIGSKMVEKGETVAVLAIDPSSQVSKGSILGDKTRMENLSNHVNAFIRPSPAGETLGGVARKTRETIILCEAAGYQNILIETVGVGQSEIAVHSMVDFFLLLLQPGAGDELQGIKRGIVEMADGVAVNKASGEQLKLAQKAAQTYKNALHLLPPKINTWSPKVSLIDSISHYGIDQILEMLAVFKSTMVENGYFEKNRIRQAKFWLNESIKDGLNNTFFNNEKIISNLEKIESEIAKGIRSPFEAAEYLLDIFFNKNQP